MIERKKTNPLSRYNRELLGIIDQYVQQTGDHTPDLYKVAVWAHEMGLLEPRQRDVYRQFARDMANACRRDYITDDNGEPVRRRHSYKERRGGEQLTFWFKMEEGTPKQMRASAAGRRRGTLMDILQLDRDVRYYNTHHNPGDPIEIDANFEPDLAERRMPTAYPDAPPDHQEE